jgi:hypothetical protein
MGLKFQKFHFFSKKLIYFSIFNFQFQIQIQIWNFFDFKLFFFEFRTPFFKKSYVSLTTDYT